MSKSYLDCILAVPKEGCHRCFKPCRNDFVVQNVSKVFFLCYYLQCRFKIFITVFPFLYVKANSKEIGEEILFPYLIQKNADVSINFLLRFKANYLEKMRCYPYFSFWIPIAFAKTYFLRMVPIWRKNCM